MGSLVMEGVSMIQTKAESLLRLVGVLAIVVGAIAFAPMAVSAANAGVSAHVLAQINDDGNCVNGTVDGDVPGNATGCTVDGDVLGDCTGSVVSGTVGGDATDCEV